MSPPPPQIVPHFEVNIDFRFDFLSPEAVPYCSTKLVIDLFHQNNFA